jgi:2'-5' RNA ligase
MRINEQLKRIKQIMNLTENKQTYDYGCVMLYFDENILNDIHQIIQPEDLYIEGDGYGLEREPHCTLLYGLHPEVTDKNVEDVIGNFTYTTCKCHNVSCFENEKYDVLKYDVMGDNLFETNEKLKQYPYTSNFPNYHPHMTIGYLKPGKGKKYIDLVNETFKELQPHPQYVVYSKPSGDKVKFNIRVD